MVLRTSADCRGPLDVVFGKIEVFFVNCFCCKVAKQLVFIIIISFVIIVLCCIIKCAFPGRWRL
jgi:hypothetical protein